MKTITTLFLLAIVQVLSFGQSDDYEKLTSSMTKNRGAMTMTISREVLSFIEMTLGEDSQEAKTITGNLTDVKIILCPTLSGKPAAFIDDAASYLPQRNYTEIKEDENGNKIGDENLKIMVLRRGLKVKECHIITGSDSSGIIISFFGDFHVKNIMKLKEKANKIGQQTLPRQYSAAGW